MNEKKELNKIYKMAIRLQRDLVNFTVRYEKSETARYTGLAETQLSSNLRWLREATGILLKKRPKK